MAVICWATKTLPWRNSLLFTSVLDQPVTLLAAWSAPGFYVCFSLFSPRNTVDPHYSRVCELPTHENLFVTPKTILAALSGSFRDMCWATKNVHHLMCTFRLRPNKDVLPSFSSHNVNECLFCDPFSTTFFSTFLYFLLVVLLCKFVARISWSAVRCPECMTVVCLTKKIHVIDRFPSSIVLLCYWLWLQWLWINNVY